MELFYLKSFYVHLASMMTVPVSGHVVIHRLSTPSRLTLSKKNIIADRKCHSLAAPYMDSFAGVTNTFIRQQGVPSTQIRKGVFLGGRGEGRQPN